MRTSSQIAAMALIVTALAPMSAFAKSDDGSSRGKTISSIAREAREHGKESEKEERENEKQEKKDSRVTQKKSTIEGMVTALNGSAISVKRGNGSVIIVQAANAKIVRRFGAAMTLADIQTNDRLVITGTVTTGTEITATLIRDISLQTRSGIFSGMVASVSAEAKTFVLQTNKRDSQTIIVNTATKITKNGNVATFGDLAVSGTIRVAGVWNRTNESVTATSISITTPLVRVHVQGKVTVDGDSEVTIVTDDQKTYIVDLKKSDVRFSQEERMNKKQIQVGDRLDIWSKSEVNSTRLNAYAIRNLSWQNRKTQVVTMNDQLGTIQSSVGNRIALKLGNGYVWTMATSTNASVLKPSAGNKNRFDAVSVGQANVTVTGDPQCRLSAPACATPSIQFRVTVNVVAKS